MLAIIVTITHTALVVVMGLIVHYYKESNELARAFSYGWASSPGARGRWV
jgi:hypothetical protein